MKETTSSVPPPKNSIHTNIGELSGYEAEKYRTVSSKVADLVFAESPNLILTAKEQRTVLRQCVKEGVPPEEAVRLCLKNRGTIFGLSTEKKN